MTLSELDHLIIDLTVRLKTGPAFQRPEHGKNLEHQCKVIEWERRLKNFLHYCRECRRIYRFEFENDLV